MSGATQQSVLDLRVGAVWRRAQQLHLSTGLLALCGWAIPLFLAGMVVDWLMDLPALGRLAILAMLLGFSLYQAWRHGWSHIRPFDAAKTALWIESHLGGLESLLVTGVQFRRTGPTAGTSKPLWELTRRKADEVAEQLRGKQIVSFQQLRRPATVALLLIGVIGVFAAVNGPFLAAGAARIFSPWTVVAYPTKTQLDLGKGDLVVKEGASARIGARVAGVVPDKAKLLLRTGTGHPREVILEITGHACEYTIASASRDFTYQIRAGDARSAWHRVRVVPAPRVERVKVDLKFRDYLKRNPKTVEALTLTVPEGTGVNWQLTLDRAISEAVFTLDGAKPVKLQVSGDGRQVKTNEMASASRGYSFSWVERKHGFSFTSPRYYLQVASDQPPRVELTSPEANLVAMLDRPLDLVVRARDDHGIAAATVTYRVNRRPEKTVAPLTPIRNAEGDQRIDWDYRKVLRDLKVGDTVSFVVEVRDQYPEPQGPHSARSETRRITFLSKEEYLEQIGRQRDRLLSRVRSVYRQERAAHELVRNLNPNDDSFMQTCQLEAVRQEMVRNQLKETASQVRALLDDLAANNVSDAVEGESLVRLRSALLDIAEKHLARAASLLRDQGGATGGDASKAPDPSSAARVVNTAARELGSLVLQRGIDSAQEVFARETHMLAQIQSSLRMQTTETEAGNGAEVLSKQQEELAQWIHRLLSDLQDGMRYTKRPLAVLRLSRSIKELCIVGAEATMREVAGLIRQGRTDQATNLQAGLVRTMLGAEFSVRIGGGFAALVKARNLLVSLVKAQKELRVECEAMTAGQFKKHRSGIADTQALLRRKLLLMLLPSIPAPRARLFDDAPPQSPPTADLLAKAQLAMKDALTQIAAGQREATAARQRKAETVITALAGIVTQCSVDMGLKTQGLSSLVSAVNKRMSRIEEYETRQIGLVEEADSAVAEKAKVDNLAESQQFLAEEVAQFRKELVDENKTTQDKDLLPLLSRLDRVEQAMSRATGSLKNNQGDKAIKQQENAADALAEARALTEAQSARLGLLQDLFMFQRAVGYAKGYMADIVAEQRDLIAATEKAKQDMPQHLLPVLGNLRRCLVDVAPLLDLVAGRLDAGTPLAFAASDIAEAMSSLDSGDKADAIDAQKAVADSLEKVEKLVQAVQTQTGYVAEIVEFLHGTLADAALMKYRQEELKQKVASAPAARLKALADEQRALQAEAETYGRQLEKATGMTNYAAAAKLMNKALKPMEAGDAPAAIEQMELAVSSLAANAEDLFAVISMLHGLPSIEVTAQSPKELVRLIDVLAVASDHRELSRSTHVAEPNALAGLAAKQRELASRCKRFVPGDQPHLKLVAAHQHLSAAASAWQSSDRGKVKDSQKAADEQLRHFIVEQALLLGTAQAAAGASDPDAPPSGGIGSDAEHAVTAGFISDFVSGEAPKDKRTEWQVLRDRNRAALNQNFARELPLEYRALLKNYYERVAK